MSKTVFVLGAGATRSCSFVPGMKRTGRCLPPLDADFFTQLQRVSSAANADRLNRLVEGLVEWFGSNYALGMEQVFCHLEHAERMLKHLGKDASADCRKVMSLKRDLVQSIAIILGEALTPVKEGGSVATICVVATGTTGSFRTLPKKEMRSFHSTTTAS